MRARGGRRTASIAGPAIFEGPRLARSPNRGGDVVVAEGTTGSNRLWLLGSDLLRLRIGLAGPALAVCANILPPAFLVVFLRRCPILLPL